LSSEIIAFSSNSISHGVKGKECSPEVSWKGKEVKSAFKRVPESWCKSNTTKKEKTGYKWWKKERDSSEGGGEVCQARPTAQLSNELPL